MPTPPLYTIDKAIYSRRDSLNMFLLGLAFIPTLLLIPTLPLIFTLPITALANCRHVMASCGKLLSRDQKIVYITLSGASVLLISFL